MWLLDSLKWLGRYLDKLLFEGNFSDYNAWMDYYEEANQAMSEYEEWMRENWEKNLTVEEILDARHRENQKLLKALDRLSARIGEKI